MKKAIATVLIGLLALGSVAVIAAPSAFAQDTDSTEERQAARADRKAQKIETLTNVLGITAEEFQAARESGQSLADVAGAQGVDVQSVIDSLLANAQARIDAKIADGRIDADQASERLAAIEERITARVHGEEVERNGRRGHRHNRGQTGLDGEV